ncbi:serine/threonine protein kinase [Mycobacterium sp. CBMA 234]|uniref:DsbA family protein n=1 Tax=Mycolicibacterium sp. CBMA 234 TaxID=1918495 RepID=UPI001EE43CB3|nr:thioredoxin domain-containing protein [Mycolicibacterium sp. CBMA 234]MUL67517.1 serine/threonine protein kinase [Mycolicibacterium sp. CBMA 234]
MVRSKMNILLAVFGVLVALLMCGPVAGQAHAAAAAPAGDVISIGDPNALGQIDLYVDPLCPYSGKMIRKDGDEMGRRIENGALRVNLRFVNFLEKYSASGTYDRRAIYAAFAVAGESKSSDVAWHFVQQIFSKEQQPHEKGGTDLSNDQLAELANHVGAPQSAQDMIRLGLPVGYDAQVIAANNLELLHDFPEPGVPLVVINGKPIDGDDDWLNQLPS